MKRRGHDDMITRYLRLFDSWWTDSSTVHVYSRQYEIIFGIIWVVSGVTGAGLRISVVTGRVCPDPRSVIDIIIASTLPQIETCNWNVKCLYDEDNYVDYSGDDIWPQLPHVMSPYTGGWIPPPDLLLTIQIDTRDWWLSSRHISWLRCTPGISK